MDQALAAVRAWLPARTKAIDELAARDEMFCEICRDFAEAQRELASWDASSDPERFSRCAEYRELVAGLGKEIEDALEKATVVHPFVRRPH